MECVEIQNAAPTNLKNVVIEKVLSLAILPGQSIACVETVDEVQSCPAENHNIVDSDNEAPDNCR